MTTKNVLVVDDEVGIRELLFEILFDEGYEVSLAENATQARSLVEQRAPDIVLLDIWMPDTDGLALLREWVEAGRLTMPVIMMSGHGTIETALEATRIGAVDFLEKPIALKKLLATVAHFLQKGVSIPAIQPKQDAAMTADGGNLLIEIAPGLSFKEAREQFDVQFLSHQIDSAAGNIAEVADKIGLERTHLYRKLKQLGIKPSKRAGDEKL